MRRWLNWSSMYLCSHEIPGPREHLLRDWSSCWTHSEGVDRSPGAHRRSRCPSPHSSKLLCSIWNKWLKIKIIQHILISKTKHFILFHKITIMHFFFAWLGNAQNVANVIQFQITKMTSLQKGESTKNSITISNKKHNTPKWRLYLRI